MIPNDDPRCRCHTGHDFVESFLRITYEWEIGSSRGIVRLSIDPECPIHKDEWNATPLREEDNPLSAEPGAGAGES